MSHASGVRRQASGQASGRRGWTRRAFMALLAVVAVRLPKPKPKPKTPWIGHV